MSRWRRWSAHGALLVIWACFAVWQYQEYRHERHLSRETLHRQAHSIMDALGGGIRSHRRLGRFFAHQLQGVLDALIEAPDIVAVAVVTPAGDTVMAAGAIDQADVAHPPVLGDAWLPSGFRLTDRFVLDADAGGLGSGTGSPGGPGLGHRGRGFGLGPGPGGPPTGRFGERRSGAEDGLFGSEFIAVLLLDRTGVDRLCQRSAWLHAAVSAGGGLVFLCIALVWRTTVRLVEAEGQARVLEAEAEHLRDLGQAAAGLAHETRNPLGLVRGWIQQLAQSGQLPPAQQQRVEALVEECDRVTARINQFLAFARPRAPQPTRVDLITLIEQLAALLQPDLAAKQLRLERVVAAQMTAVRADPEMLRQALFNLVQNAIEFSPPGETVAIAVRQGENGACRIEVADRGPAVPAENVVSLFAPYFTTRTGGTGLGLAIVRRIATTHGWQADYQPRPGGGALFWLDRIERLDGQQTSHPDR